LDVELSRPNAVVFKVIDPLFVETVLDFIAFTFAAIGQLFYIDGNKLILWSIQY
jgi:hypothetical protein